MTKDQFDAALLELGWVAGKQSHSIYRFKNVDGKRLIIFTSLLSQPEYTFEQQLEELKKRI